MGKWEPRQKTKQAKNGKWKMGGGEGKVKPGNWLCNIETDGSLDNTKMCNCVNMNYIMSALSCYTGDIPYMILLWRGRESGLENRN